VALLPKALLGAAMVVLIAVLSRTRNFYVAGLVPLFPSFALIAHWIVGSERTVRDLRATVLFGMLGVVPYLAYLAAVYVLVARVRLAAALAASTGVWLVVAGALVAAWGRR
jgi:membrane protein GlpM